MLEWKESYSVHIRKIDAQHKKIVEIINRLFPLSPDKAEEKQLEGIFDDLRKYIQEHFRDEEELMLKQKPMALINIFNYLWDWFAHHILEIDKKYQPYFNQQGAH